MRSVIPAQAGIQGGSATELNLELNGPSMRIGGPCAFLPQSLCWALETAGSGHFTAYESAGYRKQALKLERQDFVSLESHREWLCARGRYPLLGDIRGVVQGSLDGLGCDGRIALDNLPTVRPAARPG